MEDNSDKIETLVSDINVIIQEFKELSTFLSSQESVSHLSQSSWQWQGGILGAIREHKEEKRLSKIMNTPLYKDKSYYQLAFHIISQTEALAEKQMEIQSLTLKDNDIYYEGVKMIYIAVVGVIKAWRDYAPEVARASITIGDEKKVSLLPTVEDWTKDSIKKMDLPEGLTIYLNESSKDKGGCLGVVLFAIIALSSTLILI